MTFAVADMKMIAGGAVQLWKYETADADVQAANYFNDFSDELHVGDIIFVDEDTDGAGNRNTVTLTVRSIASGVVVVG